MHCVLGQDSWDDPQLRVYGFVFYNKYVHVVYVNAKFMDVEYSNMEAQRRYIWDFYPAEKLEVAGDQFRTFDPTEDNFDFLIRNVGHDRIRTFFSHCVNVDFNGTWNLNHLLRLARRLPSKLNRLTFTHYDLVIGGEPSQLFQSNIGRLFDVKYLIIDFGPFGTDQFGRIAQTVLQCFMDRSLITLSMNFNAFNVETFECLRSAIDFHIRPATASFCVISITFGKPATRNIYNWMDSLGFKRQTIPGFDAYTSFTGWRDNRRWYFHFKGTPNLDPSIMADKFVKDDKDKLIERLRAKLQIALPYVPPNLLDDDDAEVTSRQTSNGATRTLGTNDAAHHGGRATPESAGRGGFSTSHGGGVLTSSATQRGGFSASAAVRRESTSNVPNDGSNINPSTGQPRRFTRPFLGDSAQSSVSSSTYSEDLTTKEERPQPTPPVSGNALHRRGTSRNGQQVERRSGIAHLEPSLHEFHPYNAYGTKRPQLDLDVANAIGTQHYEVAEIAGGIRVLTFEETITRAMFSNGRTNDFNSQLIAHLFRTCRADERLTLESKEIQGSAYFGADIPMLKRFMGSVNSLRCHGLFKPRYLQRIVDASTASIIDVSNCEFSEEFELANFLDSLHLGLESLIVDATNFTKCNFKKDVYNILDHFLADGGYKRFKTLVMQSNELCSLEKFKKLVAVCQHEQLKDFNLTFYSSSPLFLDVYEHLLAVGFLDGGVTHVSHFGRGPYATMFKKGLKFGFPQALDR